MSTQTLNAGTIKRIHVNQHHIRHNSKADPSDHLPVFTVKTSKKNWKATKVDVRGDSRMVYRPNDPLPCGARVWMETYAEVVVAEA